MSPRMRQALLRTFPPASTGLFPGAEFRRRRCHDPCDGTWKESLVCRDDDTHQVRNPRRSDRLMERCSRESTRIHRDMA
ncbi:hypothetical protein J3459_010853 [Metarhizium acridum]|uniref:uncharacterized protein n=1 Tax=Metarhizium acridum TaxID=92637 RepID=UPI001C6AD325|nr:hypothetical protein J3458_019685 [Metarhizium acridum]KAG8420636.1 hypothetical protein J3459_010853 [Metarhizium acridum]